jgi:Cap4, dsDNA endonuclease domain
MPDRTIPAPDTVPATGDPGDDTALRYRYQWTYAAIICCLLLDETQDIVEVFCEHHEDVLIKRADGKFSGLQIKTRELDQEVWKTSDDAVRSSFARFAKLEAQFPGHFQTFRFLTNHPLYAAGNGKDLRYVLKKSKEVASVGDLSGPAAKFLSHIARKAGCTAEVAFTALSKADADDSLPKLADIEVRLVDTLTLVWLRARDCSYASVVRAARYLASECKRASSLAHQDVLPAYLPATADPTGTELAARLAAKRIDRRRILELLDRGLNATAPLDGSPEKLTEPGTGAKDLLLKKLDAGGFSAVSLNSAEDLRNKADYLGIVWTKKHGRIRGLQQYGHVRSLVLSDAARAFEATKTEEHPFGLEMLSMLRSRFQQRREEGSQLFECSNEHLEGFVFSLTSECKVQWSIDRPWEAE